MSSESIKKPVQIPKNDNDSYSKPAMKSEALH